MTNTKENSPFYHNKDGKASHINFYNNPNKFLDLGLCAFEKALNIFLTIKAKITNLKLFYSKNTQKYFTQLISKTHENKAIIGLFSIAAIVGSTAIVFNNIERAKEPALVFSVNLLDNHRPTLLKEPPQTFKHKFMTSFFPSKADAFMKLLIVTEGKSNTFYKDNLGIATGYGWNPTKTPTSLNKEIIESMSLNAKETKAILDISNNSNVQSIPKSLKNIVFSDKQLNKSAKVMLAYYEQDFLKVMKVKANDKEQDYPKLVEKYQKLPYNQQAVLIHMTYKVGATNLLKYNDFFDQLFQYLKDPSPKNLAITSASFEYSYKNKLGEYQRDTRVEQTHESFFLYCLQDDKNLDLNLNNCQKTARDDSIAPIKTALSVKIK